jgi:hypothetical protein
MRCGTQVGVQRSAHTSQADATRMHVTSGFYPGKGAKHNLGQGQRGQAEVGELPREAGDRSGSRRSRRTPRRLRRPVRP